MIWNNLLEPVGAKSNWNPGSRLRCPSKESPYLMTDKNSDDDDDDVDVQRPDKTAFERIGTSSTTSKSTTDLTTTKRRKRRKKPRHRRSKEDFESFVYNDDDLGCNIL